ncbi:Imm32 family immunity protein [Dyella choica]|uniref:Uncharacterized protein n=1 Tax=Dyella choica TaxID=1927959 RepID=A0A432LZE8_9GAMM|nr:hypothetical protein [Dyella choica]RUL69008.1 hypothetical protein EKH80_23050 [Dyella choica]
MKIYGYVDEGSAVEDINPSMLAEITVVATPEELRNIAAFLLLSASEMDDMGERFGHLHLADKQPEFRDSPHFVVVNSNLVRAGT